MVPLCCTSHPQGWKWFLSSLWSPCVLIIGHLTHVFLQTIVLVFTESTLLEGTLETPSSECPATAWSVPVWPGQARQLLQLGRCRRPLTTRPCRLPASIRVFDWRYCNTVLLLSVSKDIRNHEQNERSMFVFCDRLLTFLAWHDRKVGKVEVKI